MSNPLLDKNFINSFIKGVVNTLKVMAATEASPGTPSVEKEYKVKGEVAGLIGMVSDNVKGNLTFTFEKEALFVILKNMLGEEYTEITPEAADAVGEFTNMIYGSAKTTLNQSGYNFSMALPTVVMGNFKIADLHAGTTLVVPFNIGSAKIYIEITVDIAK